MLDHDASLTVPGFVRSRASERGDAVALQIVGGEQLTYEAWDLRSNAAARGLRALGVGPGDRVVLVFGGDWLQYAVGYVATHKVGAVAVPVLCQMGHQYVDWVCGASRAKLAVSDGTVHPWHGATVRGLEEGRAADVIAPCPGPDADAEVLYTSGTTGVPKGVVATHANVLWTVQGMGRTLERIVAHALPPATTIGQGLLVQALSPDPHRMVIMPRFEAREFLQVVSDFQPTDVVLVPAMAIALTGVRDIAAYALADVEIVRTASSAITPTALAALDRIFSGARIVNMYSSSEAYPARVRMHYDPDRPTALGRPQGATHVRIVNPDGTTAAPGSPGEVQLQAVGAPRRRYDGAPSQGDNVFLHDGYVATGDIGRVDDDGYLYLLDRRTDLIIAGGLNISTLEIQEVLEAHPNVSEAAAVGMPHPVLGEFVAAAVTSPADIDAIALRRYALARLGVVKAPRLIVQVNEFPRTALGKIRKRELRQLLDLEANRSDGRPTTLTEITVVAIVAAVLGRDQLGVDADFLALGGSSLDALDVTARVRATLQRDVSVSALMESATLAEFARAVDEAPVAIDSGDAIAPAQRTGATDER